MELTGFKQFLTDIDSSELTISAYCQDMSLFSSWFEQSNGQSLTPQNLTSIDVREYKQWLLLNKKLRPATINRKIASIRMYAKWAVESKQITFNPISGVKRVAEQRLAPKWLTKTEQAALLREAERQILAAHTPARKFESQRNLSILILLQNTGIRLTECTTLEVQDFQITDRKGLLTVRCGKGGKTRVIPLNSSARKAISDWMQIRPMNSGNKLFIGKNGDLQQRAIQKIFSALGEKAHINVTPHSFRHSFAKNLIDTHQVSLDRVGQICGHKSLDSTKIYTVGSMQDLQESVDFLDG
jgi:site-specific recombinase XerD